MGNRAANRLTGLAVAALAAAFWLWVIPNHSSASDYGWMRPRTLPTICAVSLIVLGLVHAALPRGAIEVSGREALRVAGLGVGFAIALWAMSRWGFLVIAPIGAGALMWALGERRWPWLAAGIVAVPGFVWLVVEHLLQRPLP